LWREKEVISPAGEYLAGGYLPPKNKRAAILISKRGGPFIEPPKIFAPPNAVFGEEYIKRALKRAANYLTKGAKLYVCKEENVFQKDKL